MRRNSEFVLRQIAGKNVVVPLGQAAEAFRGMITLNKTGKFLWDLLETEQTEEGTEETSAEDKKEDEVIIDPQTGEEVKKPDLSNDPSIDQSTGMLKDLSQDDDYPSDILENVQPSVDETE